MFDPAMTVRFERFRQETLDCIPGCIPLQSEEATALGAAEIGWVVNFPSGTRGVGSFLGRYAFGAR